MTSGEWADGLKKNWYLMLLAGGLLVGGVVMAFTEKEEEVQALAARSEQSIGNTGKPSSDAGDPSRFWKKPSTDEKAARDLERYQEVLRSDPDPEDEVLALVRSANVYYSKLGDYQQASDFYERVLRDYPDYDKNMHSVYANLAACYERMGNTGMERSTYNRMKAHFEPGSHPYVFAVEALKRM